MENNRTAVTMPMFWRIRMATSSSMGGSGSVRRRGVDVQRARDDVGLGEFVTPKLAHNAPVIHDRHPVAAANELVIVGRIEQDGGALIGELAHQPVKLL